MAVGVSTIVQANKFQGEVASVEKYFVFGGEGLDADDNLKKFHSVNTDTDFDKLFGADESELKTQLIAARRNAGEGWNALAYGYKTGGLTDFLKDIVTENCSVEAVVVCTPQSSADSLIKLQAKAKDFIDTKSRPLTIICCCSGIESETESWSDYLDRCELITKGVAADRVHIVPNLFKDAVGAYAGRLCSNRATIADTPIRTMTGAVSFDSEELPLDKSNIALGTADLISLNKLRFSVPFRYTDIPGWYWSDGQLLDAPAGDFQVIEYRRILDKLARQMRPILIANIGNRNFNDTPQSMAFYKTKFMKPAREMAQTVVVNGEVIVGEIEPVKEDDIVIKWVSQTEVRLYISATPYKCPKKLTTYIGINLSE